MVNYIDNLSEHNMQCIMLTAGVPSDDRVVHVYDINPDNNLPICVSARYRNGIWIGTETSQNLTGCFTDKAVWGETVFCTVKSAGTVDNRTGRNIWTPTFSDYCDIGLDTASSESQAESENNYYQDLH